MNDTTFKTDFYGVRRVFADHTSHGIAHGKKDVENLLIACQQWLAEEAEREQAKLNAEKEQRRKQWEELNKEFGNFALISVSPYRRVLRKNIEKDFDNEYQDGKGFVLIDKINHGGIFGGAEYETGDCVYYFSGGDVDRDWCFVTNNLEEMVAKFSLTMK